VFKFSEIEDAEEAARCFNRSREEFYGSIRHLEVMARICNPHLLKRRTAETTMLMRIAATDKSTAAMRTTAESLIQTSIFNLSDRLHRELCDRRLMLG
jgi:hypothetical protein